MAWTILKPLPNSTARPLISSQVRVSTKGKKSLQVFFSGTLYEELDKPEFATIEVGADEHHGCLMIRFAKLAGDFKFSNFTGGGGRLNLPHLEGVVPDKQTPAMQCKTLERGDGFYAIKLPLAEWEQALVKPAAPVRREPAAAAAPVRADGPKPVLQEDGTVDPVSYLKSKGHTVEPRTGGRLSIDGEIHTREKVLQRINSHRARADLPAIGVAQLKMPEEA